VLCNRWQTLALPGKYSCSQRGVGAGQVCLLGQDWNAHPEHHGVPNVHDWEADIRRSTFSRRSWAFDERAGVKLVQQSFFQSLSQQEVRHLLQLQKPNTGRVAPGQAGHQIISKKWNDDIIKQSRGHSQTLKSKRFGHRVPKSSCFSTSMHDRAAKGARKTHYNTIKIDAQQHKIADEDHLPRLVT